MSRSRNIKPGFFTNELLVELPFEYRLLFVGMWTLADREGRLEDRPTKIKMALFPADAVDVDAGLRALHDAGFVLRYEIGGRRLIQILAWSKHQNPHFREAQSTLPDPVNQLTEGLKASDSTAMDEVKASGQPEASPESNGGVARLIPDSGFLIPKEKSKATVRQVAPADGFDAFWLAYPVKKGKAAALKAWGRLKPDAQLADAIVLKVRRQAAEDDDWLRGFAPHASTYLNGQRWNDEIAKPKLNGGTHVRQPTRADRLQAEVDRIERAEHDERLGLTDGTQHDDDVQALGVDGGELWGQVVHRIGGDVPRGGADRILLAKRSDGGHGAAD